MRLTSELMRARLAQTQRASTTSDMDTAQQLGGLNAPLKPPLASTRDAAVLVPIVDHEAGQTVLLTQRTDHLDRHAGQVAFPGGRTEDHDPDAVATALRETEEEIGLPRARIDILGALPVYETITGYAVQPIVGLIATPFDLAADLTLDPHEVASAFEVPLAFLMNPANHQLHEGTKGGITRRYYAMPYQDHYIWGATAGMIVNLHRVLMDAQSFAETIEEAS